MGSGCTHRHCIAPEPVPHELAKVPLPPYVIESPDILLINAIRVIPKPPYRIEPLDALGIRVVEALPDQPITGIYGVESDGTVNLGFSYGSVYVRGMTIEQAKAAIERHLRSSLKPGYNVSVVIAESRALQQIRGPHLVQTDGTINLGVYGAVFVDNMTVPQAKAAIEQHLSQYLVDPEISLTVTGFNSKVFYVILDGTGIGGDQIIRLPMTGKLTVLDALSQVNGLPFQAAKHKIWVARPAPAGSCQEMFLPVDYIRITRLGDTATNYQILPNDRVFVKASTLIKIDSYIALFLAPFERVFGHALLDTSLISSIQGVERGNGGNGGNGFR
jgi:polysaccharide export outer membrane protein